jgi:D-alanyl-D-alanine carboxypeptidase
MRGGKFFSLIALILALFLGGFYSLGQENNKDSSDDTLAIKVHPTPKREIPNITAGSYLLLKQTDTGWDTLVSHNANEPHRIASVTKLMTAVVAKNVIEADYEITFKKEDLLPLGTSGYYKVGESLTQENALNSLLIESNNDVARAFATSLPENSFVDEMNIFAKDFNMNNTVYRNSSGLDGTSTTTSNFSTAADLSLLLKKLLSENQSLLTITTLPKMEIRLANGTVSHLATSTDKLLSDPDFNYTVVGGKTGETTLAKKNLALIAKSNKNGKLYIGVVLFSDDNFGDMKQLFKFAN